MVDNDDTRSAEPVVRRHAAGASLPIEYVLKPRRGIPFARNAAMDAAAILPGKSNTVTRGAATAGYRGVGSLGGRGRLGGRVPAGESSDSLTCAA